MATGTPLKETILADIQTTLEAISMANSFRTTPRTVSRILKSWEELPETDFPALYITLDNDNSKDETNMEQEDMLNLAIFGYVRYSEHQENDDIAQTKLINLEADVREKLFDDRQRGNNAINTFIDGADYSRGSLEPIAVFIMRVRIEYEYQGTNTTRVLTPV